MDNRYKDYHEISGYWGEPSGIRRLDYIVSTAKRHQSATGRMPTILELGCGNGNISITLASLGFNVTAIDIDGESIITAKKNIPPGVRVDFQTKSAEELASGKDSGSYDILVCTEVLEHLSEPHLVVKSFPRLMSDDGIAIITIPNGFCMEERVRHFLVMTPLGQKFRRVIKKKLLEKDHVQSSNTSSTHIQYFSLDEMSGLLEKAGLRVCETVNSSAFFREVYYMFFRFFLMRGSWLFRRLDDLDDYLASIVAKRFASGWFFLCRK